MSDDTILAVKEISYMDNLMNRYTYSSFPVKEKEVDCDVFLLFCLTAWFLMFRYSGLILQIWSLQSPG